MSFYLYEGSDIRCIHNGVVQLAGDPEFLINGNPVITERHLLQAEIKGCTQPNSSSSKTCDKIVSITAGFSRRQMLKGEPLLLDTLQAMTNGFPGNLVSNPDAKNQVHGELSSSLDGAEGRGSGMEDDNPPFVDFRIEARGGISLEDPAGFRIEYADGSTEIACLENGRFRNEGISRGPYHVAFKHLSAAGWSRSIARVGDEVFLRVTARNFDDGIPVKFLIMDEERSWQDDPLAELESEVENSEATISWTWEQPPGAPIAVRLRFVAFVEHKQAVSDVLRVVPFSIDDFRGVQQRLKHEGYDCGQIDGVEGHLTRSAVKRYQEDHPPLNADGKAGSLTRASLSLGEF